MASSSTSGAMAAGRPGRQPAPAGMHAAPSGKGSHRNRQKRPAVRINEDHNTVHDVPARGSKRARTEGGGAAAAAAEDPAGPAAVAGSRLKGYSMDSDDEDDEDDDKQERYTLRDEDQHEELDQDFQDGGVRLTGFNLDEEEEEGYFDETGNFVFSKQKEDHEGDNWLQDAAQYVPKDKPAVAPNYHDAAVDPDKRSRADLLAGLIKHMKPRETVQQCMRRLGGTPAAGQRRWQKGSKGGSGSGGGGQELSEQDKAAFDEITACTDELLADGEFDVYTYSYEKVAYEIKEQESKAAMNTADDKGPKFEYKWTKDALETYGPFSAKQMLEWQEKGFFTPETMCRELKEGGREASWYSAKRVDFDLYID
eukprot:m.92628 g.92628  ORF g.92628 m.92628 type:complete len:367 (-) comp9966_c0_seq1:9-1109(-)